MQCRPSAFFLPAGVTVALILLTAASHAATGDKAGYESAKAAAKAAYDVAAKRCDESTGNAKDVCIAEAKAVRTRAEAEAEVRSQGTPKARENAAEEIAEAEYKVAREECNARSGNDKDVCVKVAKARLTRIKADAKAALKIAEAKADASKEKRTADYKVAAEKCEAMTGSAKGACISQAKARYGM